LGIATNFPTPIFFIQFFWGFSTFLKPSLGSRGKNSNQGQLHSKDGTNGTRAIASSNATLIKDNIWDKGPAGT